MLSTVLSLIIILIVLGVLGLGGYYLFRASRVFRLMYTIRQQRLDPIRDVASKGGTVELEGKAVPTEDSNIITAPFTGTDCLGYTYRIEEGVDSNTARNARRSDDGKYVILDEGTRCVPFVVEGSTGSIRVDPDGANLEFETQTHEHFPWRDLPDPIENYVESTADIEKQDVVLNSVPVLKHIATWVMKNERRFIEGRLDIDEKVYVRRGTTHTSEWERDFSDVVGTGPDESEFTIYNTSKRAVVRRFAKQGLKALLMGLSGVGAALIVFYGTI